MLRLWQKWFLHRNQTVCKYYYSLLSKTVSTYTYHIYMNVHRYRNICKLHAYKKALTACVFASVFADCKFQLTEQHFWYLLFCLFPFMDEQILPLSASIFCLSLQSLFLAFTKRWNNLFYLFVKFLLMFSYIFPFWKCNVIVNINIYTFKGTYCCRICTAMLTFLHP